MSAAPPAAGAPIPAPRAAGRTLGELFARGHDNNFNLLRFLAAFGVLISHSYPVVLGIKANAEPFAQRIGYTLGGIAVDVFFVTSGFLVTASLLRLDDIKAFTRARALRILPALLPMALLCALVIGPWFTTEPLSHYFSRADTWKFIVKNATIVTGWKDKLPGVFDDLPLAHAVNGSLWTLPFEIRCYAAVAALWFLARRLGSGTARRFGLVLACLTGALLLAFWIAHRVDYRHWHTFRLFFMFASGALFQVARERVPMNHAIAAVLVLALAASVVLPAGFFWIYPPVVGYLALYAAYVPGGVLRQFNRLGDYSYGIYIYAFPVQQSLIASFPSITVAQLMAAGGAITLALAMLSWHLVEKRALRRKPRRALEFADAPENPPPSQGEAASP